MAESLAYHTVVAAMEGRGRFDPRERFVMAIKACVDGHVPYLRYRHAASKKRSQGWNEDSVARAVFDWLHSDLNPAVQLGRLAPDAIRGLGLYNLYNQSVNLGVQTKVDANGVSRVLKTSDRDDELCAAGALAVMGWIGREIAQRKPGQTPNLLSGWQVASYLGANPLASAQAMHLLEDGGDVEPQTLALSLGVSLRTLQRQVAREGLTLTSLRMAARQQRALRLLASGANLSQAAAMAGYADHAHMTRGLKTACGLTPRQMAALFAR